MIFKDVVAQEKKILLKRRERLQQQHGDEIQRNWFGIALSGGGIRSATINLGFLKTLNRFGILQKADYMSSVSGGGYTHSYVQATVKEKGSFKELFTENQINTMRQHGEYMIPGQGFFKSFNGLLLAVAFLVSWLMSLVGPAIFVGMMYYLYEIITGLTGNPFEDTSSVLQGFSHWAVWICGGLFTVHFVVNVIMNFNLGISKRLNRVELVIGLVAILLYLWIWVSHIDAGERPTYGQLLDYGINAVLLFLLGFFTNPNALSFHRYYRKQLADLFLRFSGAHHNTHLSTLCNVESERQADFTAPYPLINTCLNLQNPGGGDKFKGSKASDYFLLSPMYCGSKLTEYVPIDRYWDYKNMTLPAAVTISAAAVNPGMGIYSNKLLSVLMTVFNARLGFWISNPTTRTKFFPIIWWPIYFFRELLGRIGLSNNMINISDGGHIENLGAYELLRRGCRLIIAVDAGEDKQYTFADLNNLIIRARNEMGLEIRFRDNQQPEDLIRPRPSQVYSKQRYAIADIFQWWDDGKATDFPAPTEEERGVVPPNLKKPRKVGVFVYVKSSVTEPKGKPILNEEENRLKYGTYKYKIYHPDFPHEPTSDQFFDEIQWESYYQLGQFLGADVLGIDNLENACEDDISVEHLLARFDPDFAAAIALPEAGAEKEAAEIFESFPGEEPSKSVLPPAPPVLPPAEVEVIGAPKEEEAVPEATYRM